MDTSGKCLMGGNGTGEFQHSLPYSAREAILNYSIDDSDVE